MSWLKKIDRSRLHPGLVAVLDLAFEKLEAAGNPFKAYSGLRTFAEQDKLYAQGRTTGKKGAIVTKARGGQSMHNYGLAVDSAPFNMLTEDPDDVWWPDPDKRDGELWFALEKALGEAADEIDAGKDWDGIDYEWGGRWKFRDVPHIQVRTTLSELRHGLYPYCRDVEWLVSAHTTFLFDTPWMLRRVQYLLNMQSYACGAVDGVMGKRSIAALEDFQSNNGIKVELDLENKINWRITKETVEKLVRLDHAAISQRPDPNDALCTPA